MKKTILIFCLFCFTNSVFAQNISNKIDTLIDAYAKLGKFNGAALVAKDGKILLNKGYGYRNDSAKILNDENSIFQLGSITKQFTSAIILKLQQQNKLNITDKISKYFPGYPKAIALPLNNCSRTLPAFITIPMIQVLWRMK